jgi:hypothetical protein
VSYLDLVGFTNAIHVSRWCQKSCGEAPGLPLLYDLAHKIREPTSGLEPLASSLRVRGLKLRGVTRPCKSPTGKRLFIPRLSYHSLRGGITRGIGSNQG